MNRHLPRVFVALAAFGCLLALLVQLFKSPTFPVATPEVSQQILQEFETAPAVSAAPAAAEIEAQSPGVERAAARAPQRFAAFQPAGPSAGQRLAPGTSQWMQAANTGRKVIGRTAPVDRATFADLSQFAAGDTVVIPLFDGEKAEGVVNVVRTESSGWVRVGGKLTAGRTGTFSLASNGREVRGLVQLPTENVAYQIATERDGKTQMVERLRSDVICAPLPRMRNEPQLAPLAGPMPAVPILNSRPEAVEVLYLDFDGETVTDPDWGGTIVAPSFNLSDATIRQIFDRVKDDWISFNVNVTTDVARYNAAEVGHRMRCIMTPNDAAAPGAGGVAFLFSFSEGGSTFSDDVPCWVFNSSVVGISEAISHEIGHTMGLRHDGRTSPSETYFFGHGSGAISWCPIMGAGYDRNVVQWSKGEYQAANQKEDDLAIITATFNHFGYAPDLVGNTRTSASPLSATVGTGAVSQPGVIERNNDVDFYIFATTGGTINLTAQPQAPSPNLDIELQLQDSAGTAIATNNPPTQLNAALTTTVPPGLYYVRVTNSAAGNNGLTTGYSTYGSIGAYSLGGTVGGLTNNPIITSPAIAVGQVNTLFSYTIVATGNPTNYGIVGTLPAGLGINPTTGVISGVPTEQGTFNVQMTAQNGSGIGSAPLQISIAPPLLTIAQAIDFEALNWITGGDLPWSAQTVETFDGDDAAQAGSIGDGQSSFIETSVTGPTKVTFQWKVSSEADNDVLAFQIDGVDVPEVEPISGEVDWTEVTEIDIPAGLHQLRWVYRKNATLADGGDTAWVDAVEFISPEAPVVTSQASVAGTVGNAFNNQITGTNIPGSFSVTAGALPPGLKLNGASGRITGVPAVAGTFNATVAATNNIGSGTLAMTFQINPSPISIAEAVDNADVTWTLGGDANWFPQTVETFFGGDAVQAGPINASQTTFFTTTITGPQTVNFYWKAESEPGSDRLRFLVDGVEAAVVDGFTEWENRSIFVGPGTHELKWSYEKDAAGSLGADTAYVDKIVITTDLLPVVTSADVANGQVGINFNYAVTATNGPDTYSAAGLPAGLNIDPGTGLISGIPAASGNFPVVLGATNEAGTGTKVVNFQIQPAPASLGDATDAPQLFWSTGGDTVWFAQSDVTFDGTDAVRSGPIANSQSSYIETQVTGPIGLRFRWRVDSEANKDFLRFFINGNFQTRISGNTGWQEVNLALGAGPQTLRWVYQKDSSVASGADTAWLDTVSLSTVTTTPAITSSLNATAYLRRSFAYQMTATNNPNSFTATGLPNGLTFEPLTGLISGQPQAAGTFNVQLQAGNPTGTGTISTLVLQVTDEPPGADAFADASSLGGVFVRSEGTNLFATAEAGEPTHAGRPASASIWWSWTAPLTGEVRIDTAGSGLDTVLSVYNAANSLATLGAPLAENDDIGSNVTSAVKIKAVAGQTYLIAVDRLTATTKAGLIVLNIGYTATGSYQGLISDVNDVATPGLATLSLTSKFTFTGTIIFDGKKWPIKGTFVGEEFNGFLNRGKSLAPLPIALRLNLDPGAEEITGTLVDGATNYTFFARHGMLKADLAASLPLALPSSFTFVIEPDEVDPALPGGLGYGTVVIDKTGKAKITGTLGDGTKFTLTSPLATDRSFVLFALPYKAGGVLAAEITLQPGATIFSPLSGAIVWRKTADAKSKTYLAGFATTARLKGYPYVKPAKDTPVLTLSMPANNLDVTFEGGDLVPEPADFTGTLDTKNKFIGVGAPEKFTLTFTTATGLFSGKFTDPAKKTHVIGGAILQGTQNRGVGIFIGNTQTGAVELKPVTLP